MEPRDSDVLIVGGGAAGLATAIFLRRERPTVTTTIADGARTLGAKILVSGGGRCNVANAIVTERDFEGGRRTIVRHVLRGWPVSATIAFFTDLGVPLHEEHDGKLFPDSNRARDVLDALTTEATRLGVRILTGRRVVGLARRDDGLHADTNAGPMAATAVVLATGGRSLPKTGSDGTGFALARSLGHTVVEPTPALAPLVLTDTSGFHASVTGVAHDAEVTIWVNGRAAARITGSILWTHFGVSGPAALDASRHWARAQVDGLAPTVTLNFFPGLAFEHIDRQLLASAKRRPKALAQTVLAESLPGSIAAALVGVLSLPAEPLAQYPRDERRRLAHALHTWTLPVSDTRGYNYAEVTAGGVALDEIDPATMESRACPGLFLVGEILDVDGRLGGFNFQWAWASAHAAAHGLAARFHQRPAMQNVVR